MSISENKKRETASEELDILGGVIDYAEQMIHDNRQISEYQNLHRRAYAKTVVIETEEIGILIFRLSATSATYPKYSSGYTTPYSPVGRLLSIASVGYEDESKIWGEYKVIETRLFDRFDGVDFLENIRNFLRMKIETEVDSAEIINLKESITKIEKPRKKSTEIELTSIIIDDDELDYTNNEETDFEEDEDSSIQIQPEEYFGLNEVFYVNQTIQQNKVISRSPIGAMYVEGIAGSGKTSAALGRTKMLCGFNAANVQDEKQFREILSEDFDFWSGEYADKFSQEGSIGFVRTDELIQYLKETCRRIDLPNLPVAEYKELQSRLKNHRKIQSSQLEGGNWKGLPKSETRESHIETTMSWLYAVDQNIASFLSKNLRCYLPSTESIANHFKINKDIPILSIVKLALDDFESSFNKIEKDLSSLNKNQKFLLNGLAEKINKEIQSTVKKILDRNILWFFSDSLVLNSRSERNMAELLIKNNVQLFKRTSSKTASRFVFLDDGKLNDDSIMLLKEDTDTELSVEELKNITALQYQLLVRENSGRKFKAYLSDIDDLYLKLLPESNDKPYVINNANRLTLLRLEKGIGSKNIEKNSHSLNTEKQTSIKSVFLKEFESSLLSKLSHVTDIYYLALKDSKKYYLDVQLAEKIHVQLESKKLANQDIDLILCLSHLIGKKFSNKNSPLSEPKFYQSVFIDEVQDFTEQQIYLMSRQADPKYKAVTIVGDIAQKLHNGYSIDIPACFPNRNIPLVQLTENLRQLDSPALALFSHIFRNYFQENKIEISKQLLKSIQNNNIILPEIYFLENPEKLDDKIIELVVASPENKTLAVIMPDNDSAQRIHSNLQTKIDEHLIESRFSENVDLSRRFIKNFTSVLNSKGLEFDIVILPYLELYDLNDRAYINKLYVGLTRAKKQLVILGTKQNKIFNDVWSIFQDNQYIVTK